MRASIERIASAVTHAMSDTLRFLLDPASIAVIGASDDRNKVGGRPLHYMKRYGYRGRVYPVNPKRRSVQGFDCYADLAALPEAPELAVIAVPGEQAAAALRDCAARGVRGAVLMSSGFAETGPAGRRAQDELVRVARDGGLRMIGPNAQGVANFRSGAVANFSTMFMEVEPLDGPIAIVSQSGAAGVVPYALLRERGLGVRYVAATGNDADVNVSDLLGPILDDPEIRLILLYLEAIDRADVLARHAERARERGVALVALKAGRSRKGAAAASSHTGALASEDAVVTAFFRRHGIWRVDDLHELPNAAPLYIRQYAPRDGRLLVMSHSGAIGVTCADAAERLGIALAELGPETGARLKAILPAFGAVHNPVDLTAGLLSDGKLFGRALDALAADQAVDMVHIGVPVAGEGYDVDAFARAAREAQTHTGKPVLVSAPQRDVLARFAAQGLGTYQSDTDALRAVQQYVAHRRLMQTRLRLPQRATPVRLPAGSGHLSEADSMSVLAQAGLPIVAHRVCRTPSEAAAAFRAIGTPCVLKASAAEIPHKTEHGLVWLHLADEAATVRAYGECSHKLARLGLPAAALVAREERGRRELALGARRDPQLGPVVLIGDGGKYIETLKDYALLVPPFTEEEVREALGGLRVWPILAGVRGEAPADVDTVCRAAVQLGDLMLGTPAIESVDVNPILAQEEGRGAVVLDAVVTLAAQESRNSEAA